MDSRPAPSKCFSCVRFFIGSTCQNSSGTVLAGLLALAGPPLVVDLALAGLTFLKFTSSLGQKRRLADGGAPSPSSSARLSSHLLHHKLPSSPNHPSRPLPCKHLLVNCASRSRFDAKCSSDQIGLRAAAAAPATRGNVAGSSGGGGHSSVGGIRGSCLTFNCSYKATTSGIASVSKRRDVVEELGVRGSSSPSCRHAVGATPVTHRNARCSLSPRRVVLAFRQFKSSVGAGVEGVPRQTSVFDWT